MCQNRQKTNIYKGQKKDEKNRALEVVKPHFKVNW